MEIFKFSEKKENKIIRLGIIGFWWFFWLFNVVDKLIGGKTFLWVGKDRFTQIVNYFDSVGIENIAVASVFLVFISVVEFIALVFATHALWHILLGHEQKAHSALFISILISLFIFSFFAIGDQIFGDRVELLEHTIYWIALVVSWFIYTLAEGRNNFLVRFKE